MHKLPNFVPFTRPNIEIRKRINSGSIGFLSKQEIEKAAVNYEEYKKRRAEMAENIESKEKIEEKEVKKKLILKKPKTSQTTRMS